MKTQGNSRIAIISASVVAVVLVGALLYKAFHVPESDFHDEPQSVMVEEAKFGPVVRYVNSIGTLVPNDSVDLKSEVSAKIDKICFNEGAIVEKGSLLIQFDESLANAKLMEAEARYRKAKSEYDALDKLADRGAAAKIKREQALAEMDISSANLNSAKAELEKHKIVAPFGGIIGIKSISEGQFVQGGAELVKLVDAYPLKVDFTVAEIDIDKIYVSQEVQIFVGGDLTQEYSAKISAIEPESDKLNHSFKVRAILDVPEEIVINSQTLKPGRFVKVRASINEGQKGILIPESAIEKSGNEAMVYIVSDGMAIRRVIIPGMTKDGFVEVLTGINEGDKVITKGVQGISDGRQVTVRDEYSSEEILKSFQNQAAAGKKRKRSRK